MALLDELLDKRCRLIDYECVREGGGGSTSWLIAFGGFAGKAGIINGLRGLGLPALRRRRPHYLQVGVRRRLVPS